MLKKKKQHPSVPGFSVPFFTGDNIFCLFLRSAKNHHSGIVEDKTKCIFEKEIRLVKLKTRMIKELQHTTWLGI